MQIGDFVIVAMNYATFLVKVTKIDQHGIWGRYAIKDGKKWNDIRTNGLFNWGGMLSVKRTKIKLNSLDK